MTVPGRLTGHVIVVTGAGSGLGAAIAGRLASEGAHPICADIDLPAAVRVQDTIRAAGGMATSIELDVASERSHVAAICRILADHEAVHGYVANAGIAGAGSATDVDRTTWDRVIAVNLTGAWLSARSILPHMVERRSGSIVLQASVAGLIGVPGIAAYSAAKGGVLSLMRQMAVEYASAGVRVNAVAPGTVPTPLVTASFAGTPSQGSADDRARVAAHPLGRLGKPEDVAATVAHLVSDDAAWMTGAVLPVDGGRTAS
jgi:NAD(P)-dependent dehydrogenase (short-subunit alcohol dehydrogenase family)